MSDAKREPHSIRFLEEEWATVTDAAAAFGIEPAVLVRRLTLKAVKDLVPEIAKRRQERRALLGR